MRKDFLGAFKKGHRCDAKEFIDEELSVKLLKLAESGCIESEKTLLWLAKFNDEYHKSVFYKKGRGAIHKTKKLKKDCMNRSNQTRRDVYCGIPLLLTYIERDLYPDDGTDADE